MANFFKKWVYKALSNSGLLRVNFMFSSAKLSQMFGSVVSGWLEVKDRLAGGA